MAMIDVSSTMIWRSPPSPAGRKLQTSPFGIPADRERFLAWRAQRETLRLLNKVDAATLRDLGITDIESVGLRRSRRT